MFNKKTLRGDIIGGISVAIVALPLAIAFGVKSMPGNPNAVAAGLYSAIFCGIFATLFGSTKGLINGPTAAMIPVLAATYLSAGFEGTIVAMLLAGILQILLGLLRLGKYVSYIPKPVIFGFTNGIAISIFKGQFDDFSNAPTLALIVIAIMFIPIIAGWINHAKKNPVCSGIKSFFQLIPASLIGLIVAITVSMLALPEAKVVTAEGIIPSGFPKFVMPVFTNLNWGAILPSVISLCLLASIESLLSAVVVDEMLDQKSNPNRELVGQGIGNVVAPLFGGLIGTGAIVRSSVNVNNGGRTKLSGILHAVIILIVVLCFAQITDYLPMAALAGILMVTAFNMMEFESFAKIGKVPYADSLVMIVTMIITVVEDLIVGVVCGIALALLLALAKKLITKKKILFFGNIGKTLEQLSKEEGNLITLDLSDIGTIDESAAESLISLKNTLDKKEKKLVITGANDKIAKVFTNLKCADILANSLETVSAE